MLLRTEKLPNYEPNSFNGPKENPEYRERLRPVTGSVDRFGVSLAPELALFSALYFLHQSFHGEAFRSVEFR